MSENADDKEKVVVVSVVVWKKLAMLPQETDDVGGFKASISERKHRCTIIVDQNGRSRVGFEAVNNWFSGSGLEPCALARQAAKRVFPG